MIVVLLATAATADPRLDPHAAMRAAPSDTAVCATCHSATPTPGQPSLYVPVGRVCFSCHASEQHTGLPTHLGRTLSPDEARRAADAGLPLDDGQVACVTCHDPHPHPVDATPIVPEAWARGVLHREPEPPSDLLRAPLKGGALCLDCHDPERLP